MTLQPLTPTELPWHQRLEARVAGALGLLVAAALVAVLAVTVNVVSTQSRTRTEGELAVTRTAFYTLLNNRIGSATYLAQLLTQLPVFRAHLTDARLSGDAPTMNAMAEDFRTQMQAAFAIVTRADGVRLGSAGWRHGDGSSPGIARGSEAAALAGRASNAIESHAKELVLIVAVPARFGDETLGALTVGYQLTDDFAAELARLARSDVALVVDGQVAATSVADGDTRDARALLSAAATGMGVKPDLLRIGTRQYVAGVFPLKPNTPGGDRGQLVVLSEWAPTQQFVDALRGQFILVGAVTLVLSLLGGVVLSRHLSRPLKDIAGAATQIAAGNFSLQLPVRGTAEAMTVAQAFNAMSVSLRSAHERLVHDAIHDHLTKLPNRALFKERLDRAISRRARHPDHQFAVLFVDLDRFKHVNDSLGHTAGDRLLVLFAERLAAAVRRDDMVLRMAGDPVTPEPTLARFGGDEFAVLLDDIREPIDAVRVAKRVQHMATIPLHVDGHDVFTGVSIGVAVASDAHLTSEDLIRDADLAMYRAKNEGGGGYAVFDAALHDAAVRRLHLETDLRHALERREFRVWYQPIVSLVTHQVVGVEALVRWAHPERGLLLPGEFLQVAEEVGLITQIDEWVLWESCLQGREWLRTGTFPMGTTISVNLSAKAFAQQALVQQVADALRTTGYPAAGLRLEVTESVAIGDPARARTVLAELRDLGVRVSLDDFGTGYSSLSYLQSLPLDTLKIDRSFVAGIGTDEDKGEIIKLIVGLARTLNLELVAEGTETAAQVDYLTSLGCQFGQGYYFARPAASTTPGSLVAMSAVRTAPRLAG